MTGKKPTIPEAYWCPHHGNGLEIRYDGNCVCRTCKNQTGKLVLEMYELQQWLDWLYRSDKRGDPILPGPTELHRILFSNLAQGMTYAVMRMNVEIESIELERTRKIATHFGLTPEALVANLKDGAFAQRLLCNVDVKDPWAWEPPF